MADRDRWTEGEEMYRYDVEHGLILSDEQVRAMNANAAAAESFKRDALSPPQASFTQYDTNPFYHAVIHVMRQVWMLRADAEIVSDPTEHCIALADAILPFVQAATLREFAEFIGKPSGKGLDRYTVSQIQMEAQARADRLEGK